MSRPLICLCAASTLLPTHASAHFDLNAMYGWQVSSTSLETSSGNGNLRNLEAVHPGGRALFQGVVQPFPLLGIVAGAGFNHTAPQDFYEDGNERLSVTARYFTVEGGLSQSFCAWSLQETVEFGVDPHADLEVHTSSFGGSRSLTARRASLNARLLRRFWHIGLLGVEGSVSAGRLGPDRTSPVFQGVSGSLLLGVTL